MGSRQTTNAFPEQSSSHERDNLSRATETVTNRRTRVATRAPKKREPIEPRQDVYGLPSPSQSQQSLVDMDSELIEIDSEYGMRRSRRTTINTRSFSYKLPSSSEDDTDGESTSTRIRTSRQNKRTQDRAELDEPEPSTSHNTASRSMSRPNKRRAIRAEEEASQSEQDGYPIIILPPPYRSDSPRPTIRRTAESDITQDSSYLQPFNSPTTGNNTGGVVTLPPISLQQENSTHGGITLPPIRSVLSLGERSRISEIEVVDLSSPPPYPSNNAADPYPSNVVDLTSSPVVLSPNTHSPAANSHKNSNINNRSPPEIIIIDDDSPVEDPSTADSPLPRGLQIKCAICLDHPKDVSFTPCGHIFCRECISTALKSQKVCSLCRRTLTKKQIKRLEFKVLSK